MTTKDRDRLARGPFPRLRIDVPKPGERCPRHHGGVEREPTRPCLLCAPHLVPVEFGGTKQ